MLSQINSHWLCVVSQCWTAATTRCWSLSSRPGNWSTSAIRSRPETMLSLVSAPIQKTAPYSRGWGERDRLIGSKLYVQGLQDLLTPGEEEIALKGNEPMRRERGETGFQQLARLLLIQKEMSGQFEHHRFACRE